MGLNISGSEDAKTIKQHCSRLSAMVVHEISKCRRSASEFRWDFHREADTHTNISADWIQTSDLALVISCIGYRVA